MTTPRRNPRMGPDHPPTRPPAPRKTPHQPHPSSKRTQKLSWIFLSAVVLLALAVVVFLFYPRSGGSDSISQGSKVATDSGKLCTIGAGWVKRGESYALLAGHCGSEGESVRIAAKTAADSNGPIIGKIVHSVTDETTDIAVIKLSSGVIDNTMTRAPSPIASNPVMGETLCLYGAATGGKLCGKVVKQTPGGMFGIDVDGGTSAINGDSGGPVFTDSEDLVGVISATGDDSGLTYISPYQRTLSEQGLL